MPTASSKLSLLSKDLFVLFMDLKDLDSEYEPYQMLEEIKVFGAGLIFGAGAFC